MASICSTSAQERGTARAAQVSPKGRLNPREPLTRAAVLLLPSAPRAAHTEHKPSYFQIDRLLLLFQAFWDPSQTHKLLAITNSYKADGEQQESPSVQMAPSPTFPFSALGYRNLLSSSLRFCQAMSDAVIKPHLPSPPFLILETVWPELLMSNSCPFGDPHGNNDTSSSQAAALHPTICSTLPPCFSTFPNVSSTKHP